MSVTMSDKAWKKVVKRIRKMKAYITELELSNSYLNKQIKSLKKFNKKQK